MNIKVNEIARETDEGKTLGELADDLKPGSDLLILNGFPSRRETLLTEGDEVVFIKRGAIPAADELEALLVSRHTPGVHAKVKDAKVGVAGLGGLGSQVAVALCRVGVGTLVLADFDVVEPSNLNRQQYFVDQLGARKTEALSETLKRINPYVAIDARAVRLTPENIPEIFSGCSVVVEAFDRAEEKAMLVETVLSRLPDAWMVAASGLAGHGPSETISCHRVGARFFVVGDLASEARPGLGLMAPRVGVAAHAQANLVLRLLLGEE